MKTSVVALLLALAAVATGQDAASPQPQASQPQSAAAPQPQKKEIKDPAEYNACAGVVGERGRETALQLGRRRFYEGIGRFAFDDWADLDALEHLRRVKAVFDVATN